MNQTMLKPELLEGKEIPRTEILEILVPFVKGISHSFSIAINSPWGTGKTTFVYQFRRQLGDDYPSIYYNAWKADFSTDPFIDFCSEILNLETDQDDKPSNEKNELLKSAKKMASNFWNNKGKITTSVIAKIATKEVAEVFDGEEYSEEISNAVSSMVSQQFDEYSAKKEAAENFAENLDSFVSKITKDKGPLIIFVDELDRCRPTYAVELLERVKHLFGVENIIFIFSVDLNQLKHAVGTLYGHDFESEGYLKRFFDLVVDLPKLSKKSYCDRLCQLYQMDDYGISTHLSCFATKYDISLRQIDRIFTLLKIQLTGQKWKPVYVVNCVFYTILKVVDDKKYNSYKQITEFDSDLSTEFEEFLEETYSTLESWAGIMMIFMVHRVVERRNAESYHTVIQKLTTSSFWKKALARCDSYESGYLSVLFNRLDFTADHARSFD